VTDTGNAAQALHELVLHRGWAELRAAHERATKRWEREVARKLVRDAEPFDQRDIDFQRGYMQAWTDLLAEPDKAEQRFEREVLRANRKADS
jgi:hypothetical protein